MYAPFLFDGLSSGTAKLLQVTSLFTRGKHRSTSLDASGGRISILCTLISGMRGVKKQSPLCDQSASHPRAKGAPTRLPLPKDGTTGKWSGCYLVFSPIVQHV